ELCGELSLGQAVLTTRPRDPRPDALALALVHARLSIAKNAFAFIRSAAGPARPPPARERRERGGNGGPGGFRLGAAYRWAAARAGNAPSGGVLVQLPD